MNRINLHQIIQKIISKIAFYIKNNVFFFLKNFKNYNLPLASYEELKLKSIVKDSLNFFFFKTNKLKKN
jgi:hypothetical protein